MPPKRKLRDTDTAHDCDGGDSSAGSKNVKVSKVSKGVTSKSPRSKSKSSTTAAGVQRHANDEGSTAGAQGDKEKRGEIKGKGRGVGSRKKDAATMGPSAIPERNKKGQLVFADYPNFRPNLTPKEVIQMGSFGGTYFRPIKSSVTEKSYRDVWKEFPAYWFEGLDVRRQVANPTYFTSVNKYGVECGGSLHMWESNGWIKSCDPYGWFQWYCRFYLGRRCEDDERQISRGLKLGSQIGVLPLEVFGPTGRWRTQLCNRILVKDTTVDDPTVSPKIRQLLQHWGYQITEADLQAHAKGRKGRG